VFLHDLSAVFLMVGEALLGCEVLFLAIGLVPIDRSNGVDDLLAFGEEILGIDKLPASMDQSDQVLTHL